MSKLIAAFGLLLFLSACVPNRKYEDVKKRAEYCEGILGKLQTENQGYKVENNELSEHLKQIQQDVILGQDDVADLKRKFKDKEDQYGKLEELYEKVLARYDRLMATTSTENDYLTNSLEKTQTDLQAKEDRLGRSQKELDLLKNQLDKKEKVLVLREQRMKELESLIAQKDAAVNGLKDKISQALTSFTGKGLTVEQRNGKVYVSMDAKLLFPSGSTKVDKNGKKAIVELAKALENERDLEIVVEGHTDTDKLNSKVYPKNNWELSVLRATSVVNIMLDNSSLNAHKLHASGRGEFIPISDDKARNRRIEVILTPNLDKLFEIISN